MESLRSKRVVSSAVAAVLSRVGRLCVSQLSPALDLNRHRLSRLSGLAVTQPPLLSDRLYRTLILLKNGPK